jgi:hypothetical protein
VRETYVKMLELLRSRSDFLQTSIAKCLPYFATFFPEESSTHLLNSLKIIEESHDDIEIQAAGYIIAGFPDYTHYLLKIGVVKGLGLKSIKEFNILESLEKNFQANKTDPIRKEASLYAYSAMSVVLGKSYEYFAIKFLHFVLDSFAQTKESVRKAAQKASKAIMSKLSGQGVKKVLPILLEGK